MTQLSKIDVINHGDGECHLRIESTISNPSEREISQVDYQVWYLTSDDFVFDANEIGFEPFEIKAKSSECYVTEWALSNSAFREDGIIKIQGYAKIYSVDEIHLGSFDLPELSNGITYCESPSSNQYIKSPIKFAIVRRDYEEVAGQADIKIYLNLVNNSDAVLDNVGCRIEYIDKRGKSIESYSADYAGTLLGGKLLMSEDSIKKTQIKGAKAKISISIPRLESVETFSGSIQLPINQP